VQLEAIHTILPRENERVESLVSVALNTSRTGLEETRRAMKALRAEPLEDLGLIYAVRNLVHNFVNRSEIKVDLNLPEQLDQFSLDEEQAIYRILQEALENIIRHAEASKVKIRFEQQGGFWQLSVKDNGVGFDPNQQKKQESLGLQGMAERAAMMGASLSIKSEVGSGTEVLLELRRKNDPDHRGG
jgi:signal transduction histidine kinase